MITRTNFLRNILSTGALLLLLQSCAAPGNQTTVRSESLSILSGSENRPLEKMLMDYAAGNGIDLQISYAGSVDIMRELKNGSQSQYDGVWPASQIWLRMGDTGKVLRHEKSIYITPVVFAVKKSVAENLGWVGNRQVTFQQILDAANAGKVRFMMTAATQSNSGAMAYLASLYAFSGGPEILTEADLAKPEIQAKVKALLSKVNRSAASSEFLGDLYIDKSDAFDGMFNYESVVASTNERLKSLGKEPLYVIYPVNGLAIADSPLAYIEKGNLKEEREFLSIQNFLTSEPTQQALAAMGRRTGAGGQARATTVFDPTQGFKPTDLLVPFNLPNTQTIERALQLYQETLRKPSMTVYLIDFSGSMSGSGESDAKAAMDLLLNQEKAKQYLLQATPSDVTVVMPFNSSVIDVRMVKGNDPQALADLSNWINNLSADGGTNIYAPVEKALEVISQQSSDKYATSVILMTDGQSNEGSFAELQEVYSKMGRATPVYSITFGSADDSQLSEISQLTSGHVYDGRSDLVKAFRQARGNN